MAIAPLQVSPLRGLVLKTMKNNLEKINTTIKYLKKFFPAKPDLIIILGSVFGKFADKVKNKKLLDYKDIPNLKIPTILGHNGKLIFGKIGNKNVVIVQGRIHYYEGHSIFDVVFLVRVLGLMKIPKIIITNAAGGINNKFRTGDLMLIKDHINNMGINPLIGEHFEEYGERFPDMSKAYDEYLLELAQNIAKKLNIKIKKGIYLAMSGPSYETPAEIKMIKKLGADAVGMSTVPEVIVANQMKMKILGISLIANTVSGFAERQLKHEDVIKASESVEDKFEILIENIIENI